MLILHIVPVPYYYNIITENVKPLRLAYLIEIKRACSAHHRMLVEQIVHFVIE